jgi:hypothetical protein
VGHQWLADRMQNGIERKEAYIDESLRIADFVLNALPETGVKLTISADDDERSEYGAVVQHHGKDLNVRFCVEMDPFSAAWLFSLWVQSPYHYSVEDHGISAAAPAERFILIKDFMSQYQERAEIGWLNSWSLSDSLASSQSSE